MNQDKNISLIISRSLIGLVIFINLHAAFLFIFDPSRFIAAFELEGLPGIIMVRSLGILFVMWNIPYLFALWHPAKFRLALYQAMIMQFIGLIGETWLLSTLPETHISLRMTAIRFIIFDSFGLITLMVATWITKTSRPIQ
jgi:hypothetical protein